MSTTLDDIKFGPYGYLFELDNFIYGSYGDSISDFQSAFDYDKSVPLERTCLPLRVVIA